ncbi:type II restriction enzyme [Corynebacterium tuberculostearicum]|uniref:type II restriction enzyme n=1 Tax=Corynebacterium tuberculostearicum TaxID=38304 RepID=UPI0038D178BE
MTSGPEARELRARFGVPESVKLGVNDWGWLRILAAGYDAELERRGYFYIGARELERLSGRQPRLMAKHDFSTSRPWIFQRLQLGIVPVSRSEYLVGRFNLYERFPETQRGEVRTLELPAGLDTLSLEGVSSEAVALNGASASGMLEDFLGCGPLQATVAGRMSTRGLKVRLPDLGVDVAVDRAQMEIDGGFESLEHLVLVEAKNHLSDDFNIRQLYFPYRRFQQRLAKDVVPVYLVYSNGIFHLYRYEFRDPADFRSIALVDSARYALSASTLDAQAALDIVRAVEPDPAGRALPQANSFERVVNLLELIALQPLSKAEITQRYDFDPRQADYYANAARYLGLAEPVEEAWEPTEHGRRVIEQPQRDARNAALIRALAARRVFREVLELSLARGAVASTAEICAAMEGLGLSLATSRRRASTVARWTQWVLDTVAEGTPRLF